MSAGNPFAPLGSKAVGVRTKEEGRGLTLGDLITAANQDASDDSAKVWNGNRLTPLENATMTDVLAKVKKMTRKLIKLEPLHTEFLLISMVLPSDEEWESVKQHESQKTRAQW